MEKTWMGNIGVNVLYTNEAIVEVINKLKYKHKSNVFFLNDHCYNLAQKDKSYLNLLNDSDFLLNDGIGIEIGAKLFGFSFKENLNGTDFIPALFDRLKVEKDRQYNVYLLGAKPGVAKAALDKLQQQFPHLKFVGEQHGYFDVDSNEVVIADINNKQTDILLVGFGMPIQEKWIADNREKLNCTLTFAVGAFLDFSSGQAVRAPGIFRKLRLEWLYRMLKEPKRLWKRNLVGHLEFFYYVLKNRRKKLNAAD